MTPRACTLIAPERRKQARDAERKASAEQEPQDLAYNPAYAMECPRHAGETLIQCQDQCWLWSLEAGADHDSLKMCDRMTMAAIQKSGLLPQEEKGFNPVTPSYL